MTNSGCPEADSQHEWHKGWRFQDTANVHAAYVEKSAFVVVKYCNIATNALISINIIIR